MPRPGVQTPLPPGSSAAICHRCPQLGPGVPSPGSSYSPSSEHKPPVLYWGGRDAVGGLGVLPLPQTLNPRPGSRPAHNPAEAAGATTAETLQTSVAPFIPAVGFTSPRRLPSALSCPPKSVLAHPSALCLSKYCYFLFCSSSPY